MYKIWDSQCNKYFADGELFDTLEDIVEQLSSYHDVDFEGTDDKDNELSIKEYFEFWELNETVDQISFLIYHGEWVIHDEAENTVYIDNTK